MDTDTINYSNEYIKEILSETKTVAVVGASSKPDRDSYKVDVFRSSDAVMGVTQEAIDINAKVVWMQLEIINYEAANLAEIAGLKVIMNRCPKIEFKKLNWTSKTN